MLENKKNKIPDLKAIDVNSIEKNTVVDLDKSIKSKLKEIASIPKINNSNKEQINELLITCDVLINECHESQTFKTNRSSSIIKLIYEYARLSLKYETYILKEQLDEMRESYSTLNIEQGELKETTSNLTYNILGFIASFSIVSASVSMFDRISTLTDALLFMAITAWILLTILIALNNFYKGNIKNKNKLQDNYFLWKAICIVIVLLVGYKAIFVIRDNQDYIFEKIGNGVYQAAKEDEKFQEYIINKISEETSIQE